MTTSGLPDDSREEDERRVERHLRDLCGRVRRARAVVAGTPGLAEALRADWRKAAWFYARFGTTVAMFQHGVRQLSEVTHAFLDLIEIPSDGPDERLSRKEAIFPDNFA